MTYQQLEAEVRHRPGLSVVELRGDIDAFGEEALNSAYSAATVNGTDPVLLNFTEAGFINSTGIALIVGLLARARKEGRRLLTCGLTDHYQQIFEITRLSAFMSIFPGEEAAVADVAGPALDASGEVTPGEAQ